MFKRKISRKKFLSALGFAGLGGLGYMRLIEPVFLGVGRHEVKIGKEAKRSPLKVLQLSDFHASSSVNLDFIAQSIQLGLDQKPDLICITGDFITQKYDRFEKYAEILKPLVNSAPTFAILGNHDGGEWVLKHHGYADTSQVRELISKAGITLLHNRAQAIRVHDWDLALVGLGDDWANECDATAAFAEMPTATTTIVLSHNPDTKKKLKPYPWDLLLCGHTHGGQLCLPLIGTPFAPVKDHRFVQGLHRWDDRWIHITRGVGNLFGLRFNCPPEVSLLTLV